MLYYRQYLAIAGMQQYVLQFVQTQEPILVRHAQDTLLITI